MSVKRQATSDLNHQNWDDDDPEDDKDMGEFKVASKDVLEKRVMRTAKRRNPISSEPNKSVFSGFGGFNKAQPSSFDFLANLTNGSKNTNGSTGSLETTSSSLFTSKPATNTGGLSAAQTSSSPMKPSQPSTWTSPFGSSVKTTSSSLFTATNSDSASKDTPFKTQQVSSSTSMDLKKSAAQTTTSVFGVAPTTSNSKPLISSTSSTPFKSQPVSSTTTATVQTSFGITTSAMTTVTPDKKTDENEKPNEKKIKYFSKLKGLNEAVSDWINKHVAQTPLCILSPIFKDYEKYLKEITEEYQAGDKEEQGKTMDIDGPAAKTANVESTKTLPPFGIQSPVSSSSQGTKMTSPFGTNNTGSSPFAKSSSTDNTKTSTLFGINNASPSKTQDTKTSMVFGNQNTGVSPFTSSAPKQDTKTSTPFGITNTNSSPLSNKDTKTSSPLAVTKTGSIPTKSEEAKASTLFGIKNTSASPFTSSPSNADSKITSPFAINTGSSVFSNSASNQDTKINTPFGISNTGSSPFNSSPLSAASKPSLFGGQTNTQSSPENKQSTFSFGVKTSPSNPNASIPSTGFSFGVTPLSSASATTSPFSQTTNAPTNPTSTTPFSFGNAKPFSFSANNVQKPSGDTPVAEQEDEEPPKVEFTPVKEDNSVYEKKCKIFVKKDTNFVDKGVGTLFIKKIEGNVKHQLLVRANTNLGTVLLNMVLAEAIPIQRMGKNNVMLVCIPTPDSKPPPTPILIRVKTGEEADELLETLNKYKA